jgi:hypothetical protein
MSTSMNRFTAGMFLAVLAALGLGGCECTGPRGSDRGPTSAPSGAGRETAADAGETNPSPARSDSASSAGGLTTEEDAMIPPGPPGIVSVSRENGLSTVRWEGTRDDTVSAYEVYRRCGAGPWTSVARVPVRNPRNEGPHDWEDRIDATCEYAVAAVDADGRVGPRSDEASPDRSVE